MISTLLNRLSLRRNNWAYQFSAEKWERDWTSRYYTGIDNAREEGIAIGEERGAHKKALETAHKLLELGLSAEQIKQATGLPESEILALQK